MPIITIKYDNKKLSKAKALALAKALCAIVKEVTKIDDVFAYADSSEINVNIAPVEVFIELSANKIIEPHILMSAIRVRLKEWKRKTKFSTKINLTIIPMQWKIEKGI